MRDAKSRTLAAWLALSLMTLAPPAFAYLDPSTGSMILSAIVGMFATAALAIKSYWYKLKSLFRPRQPDQDGQQSGQKPGKPAE